MDETYYTDEMRDFVAGLPNKHNLAIDVLLMSDGEPYISLVFNKSDYFSQRNEEIFTEMARYLIELRDGLIALGARVTFMMVGDSNA